MSLLVGLDLLAPVDGRYPAHLVTPTVFLATHLC